MSTLATPSHFLHDTFITKSQKQHPNTISSMQYIEYLLDAAVTTCRVCLFVFSVIFGEGGGGFQCVPSCFYIAVLSLMAFISMWLVKSLKVRDLRLVTGWTSSKIKNPETKITTQKGNMTPVLCY